MSESPIKVMKQLEEEDKGVIELDKQKVSEAIEKKGYYKDEGLYLRKWEGEENNDFFISTIKRLNTSFIGILNGRFQRERNGIYTYENGDIYFGNYDNDQRNTHGIYLWSPHLTSNHILSECYYGFWRQNSKDNHGIYLWIDEEEQNQSFDNADIDAFVGEIDLDKYKRGTYLTKRGDSYYVYHGNIDLSGRKNDAKAFFYSAKKDRLMKGRIVDDAFTEGHVCFFNEEGVVLNMVYCTFKTDGTVESITQREKMKESEKKAAEEEMTLFRSIILQKDYFGQLYAKYKEIVSFIKNDMNTINVLDDKDKFPKMMQLCVDYNSITIYSDIESHLKDK